MPLVPTYTPTDWVDLVTPVDEAHMDKIDTAVGQHATAINGLDTRLAAEEAMPDVPTVVNGSWIKGVGGAMVWSAITIADVASLQTSLNAKQDTSAKGAVSGYASLDSTGKVPAAQLPAAIDLRWAGAYAGATTYHEGDVVISGGVSYMALRTTTGETPAPWSSGSGAGGAAVDQVFVGIVAGSIANISPGAANSAVLIPFRMAKAWASDGAMVSINTATGNYDFGMYDSAGNRLGSSGSVAAVVGERYIPFTARISGGAGDFWLACGFSASGIRIFGDSGAAAQMQRVVASAFPLPATLVPGSTQPPLALGIIAPLV